MTKRILSRPGSMLALLCGAVQLGVFFLPWLSFSSLSVEVGTASGYQLAAGEVATKVATVSGQATEQRPWFYGCAVLAGLTLLAGALGAAQVVRRKQSGSMLVALALLGGGLTLLALSVKVGEGTLVATRPTATLWFSVGAWGLTALGGLMEVAVSMAAGERSSRPRRAKGRRS